jgi:hypothetical protein
MRAQRRSQKNKGKAKVSGSNLILKKMRQDLIFLI